MLLQWMVPGVSGSRGVSAPPPAEVEREHVSGSVTVRLQVTVADCVQETPPSCLGVTVRPALVSHGFLYL